MEAPCVAQDAELLQVMEKHRKWASRMERYHPFLSADDLLQEAAFRVMQRLREDGAVDNVGAFFHVVLRNVLRDILKRKHATSFSSWFDALPDRTGSGLSPLMILEQEEHRRAVHECIFRLPQSDVDILTLYYYRSRTVPAIAAAYGVRVEAMHMRLSRARGRLRCLLSAGGLAPPWASA